MQQCFRGIAGIACAFALSLAPIAASATSLKLSPAQQRLIDGRLNSQFNMTRLRNEGANDQRRELYEIPATGPYRVMARAAAKRHGIPVSLFERLVTAESNWNPRAKSHAGAIGLAQLMPQTAKILGVNPRVPRENLEGGARYLRMQYDRFKSWRLALAAYNAGPEAVAKYKGIPPYRETRAYVKKILPN